MKKTESDKHRLAATDAMRPEYRFDYRKSRLNRFTGRLDKGRLIVLLDPDVSKVFTTPESVNKALRALMTAIPETAKHKGTRKSRPK